MNTVLLQTVVGSTLHGTSVDDGLEDLDLMSIVVEDQQNFCGLNPEEVWTERTKPEGVRSEAGDVDHVTYGLRKYVRLVLKQNPTVMLALFAPESELRMVNSHGHALRRMAKHMICRKAGSAFTGYLDAQTKRMLGTAGQKNVTRPELIEKYGYDTKYAGHIVRLGFQGVELLTRGEITLPMPKAGRELVLDVRLGQYKIEEVAEMACELITKIHVARANSPLPEEPDYERVESWMTRTYDLVWSNKMAEF